MKVKGLNSLHSGYSLIEALVATVIIAVGILGIAGLQVISIQQNRSVVTIRVEITTNTVDDVGSGSADGMIRRSVSQTMQIRNKG